METIKRISDLDPAALLAVERVFGRQLDRSVGATLVLRVNDETTSASGGAGDAVPPWCNVLEGFSDADLTEFNAEIEKSVRLANPAA